MYMLQQILRFCGNIYTVQCLPYLYVNYCNLKLSNTWVPVGTVPNYKRCHVGIKITKDKPHGEKMMLQNKTYIYGTLKWVRSPLARPVRHCAASATSITLVSYTTQKLIDLQAVLRNRNRRNRNIFP